MKEGKAVIALTEDNEWVGFSYIEVWASGEFVSNSGLIVSLEYRGEGVARQIKEKIFELSRKKYPESKIFSITTGLALIRINAALGFDTVTFNELPKESSEYAYKQDYLFNGSSDKKSLLSMDSPRSFYRRYTNGINRRYCGDEV